MAVTRVGNVINITATNDSVNGDFIIDSMWAASAATMRTVSNSGVIFWQPTAVGQRIHFPCGLRVSGGIYRSAGTTGNLFIYLR